MKTVRLTMAQALVRWLMAQRIMLDGQEAPLFPGVFAIFGHGNVTCLGEALEAVKDRFPTWRGQNEQSMALAAIAFAKAKRRRQIMVATSSIGPGATNMVTAAAVAHSNRLPVLLLSGDTFANRVPDPVLQQVEHFHNPTLTVNDAFRAVTRYWDRITRAEQIVESLPQAVTTMLDPADCGPAFLGLSQDVQGHAYDYPAAFFEPRLHYVRRQRPDADEVSAAADVLRTAKRPLIIAGGGVHYSLATAELAQFAERHNIPVAETIAGRGVLTHTHPLNVGPLGVIGSASANALAAEADVVLAVGTRLQDFTTGSWTVFGNPDYRLIALNAARFDAAKHRAVPVVGDAMAGLAEISAALGAWRGPQAWVETARGRYAEWNALVAKVTAPTNTDTPSYAQVVGTINALAEETDTVVTAAGGLPGELTKNWRVKAPGTFDCEFGYSCMGYEIAGGWGIKMARPDSDVIVMVGDGSYLMMNSDIYSSVLTGHKLIVVVCDNGGFGVINRLQNFKGCPSFNNQIEDCKVVKPFRVDFAKHAEAMGAVAETVTSLTDLQAAFQRAKKNDRTTVLVVKVHPTTWTPGDAWWDVGVVEVNDRESMRKATAEHLAGRARQRVGV
ncbi:MAG: 3D-(3,5/4)-trihydroxycyclohexane-1,2-dione acylhydrolase (decyclizing) [Rhodospirillaceae bacterium]|nr:3D-(3,5/4)-trihydroxycyclohexane-1,2-dione acylhydrolase (decyclizing) [Rhodospirillaceae bacterium]